LLETGISTNSLDSLIATDSYIERNLFTAMKKVKKNYGATICTWSKGDYCSNNELAFA